MGCGTFTCSREYERLVPLVWLLLSDRMPRAAWYARSEWEIYDLLLSQKNKDLVGYDRPL